MINNIKNGKKITILIDMTNVKFLSKIFGGVLPRRALRPNRWTLAVWFSAWCCAAAAQGATLYVCPGNLFTNQLDQARAQAQGCREASGDGLSQAALADPPARSTAVTVAQPVPAAATPVKPHLREPASRFASSRARSQARDERTAVGAASPVLKVNPSLQRARDQDALSILQAELARTQAAQKALTGPAGGAPDNAALQRLRVDEVALRRELERFQR
ncbi:hypothetical protein [Hydrogenophaga taeniospiralis]|uniref:hypothetical protein n=1 Tax=Hydrogenophaga taeniospiralis TaxID=65656 RepID=UPI001CFBCCB7|nr:hypothetical protein [Hydrogenophaga taeniospiralis]UCU92247.1 hypothetical protein KI616_15395 [Hydrogenophaga taeniospiralis]